MADSPSFNRLTISDLNSIFTVLQRDDVYATLPLRALMQNVLNGSVHMWNAYANAQTTCVSVVQHMAEISNKDDDWDLAAIYAEDEKQWRRFLEFLANERKWNERSVILAGIDEKCHKTVEKFLKTLGNRAEIDLHGPYQLTVGKYRPPFADAPEKIFDDKELTKKLPPGFYLDRLHPSDVDLLVAHWNYDLFPDRRAYFLWAMARLPSGCVRDASQGGQPVSWCLQYPIGAGAAWFTLPQYRRRKLAQFLLPYMELAHYAKSGVPSFGGVELDNVRSFEAAATLFTAVNHRYVWIRRKVTAKPPKKTLTNSKL